MCRKAEDMYPLLKIMSGKEVKDPKDIKLKNVKVYSLSGLKTMFSVIKTSDEIKEKQKEVLKYLVDEVGMKEMKIESKYIKDLKLMNVFNIWNYLIKKHSSSFSKKLGKF
jgi:hypothetical protein